MRLLIVITDYGSLIIFLARTLQLSLSYENEIHIVCSSFKCDKYCG
jgi:hypothetical protein